jgi:Tol biopolymer transport system component
MMRGAPVTAIVVSVGLAFLATGRADSNRGTTGKVPFPRADILVFSCGSCPGAETGARLFTIRTDGRDVRLLPRSSAAYDPRWSPDGSTIAISRQLAQLWLLRADGSSARRLTDPTETVAGAMDRSPSWSPDGSRLVYVHSIPPPLDQPGSYPTAIWTIRRDACSPKKLLSAAPGAGSPDTTNVTNPELSPDGRWLAYNDVSERLWLAKSDGSQRRRLGPPELQGRAPRWSPDGTRLAFLDAQAGSLRILVLRTGRVRTIVATDIASSGGDSSYAWSPDGRWLAVALRHNYQCDDPTGPCDDLELWIVSTIDQRRRQIYRSAYGEIYGLDWRK